jgi:hypothetical protein
MSTSSASFTSSTEPESPWTRGDVIFTAFFYGYAVMIILFGILICMLFVVHDVTKKPGLDEETRWITLCEIESRI